MPTNQETMIIEKIVCFSQFLRKGGMPHCGGWGEQVRNYSAWSHAEREGNCGQEPICDICRKEEGKQGQQAQDWLV